TVRGQAHSLLQRPIRRSIMATLFSYKKQLLAAWSTLFCLIAACSDADPPVTGMPAGEVPPDPDKQGEPSLDQELNCENPVRAFQCTGAACCANEPACPEGQLPFSDACGC